MTFGASSRATLPVPVTLSFREAASCTLSESLDSDTLILNLPTAPVKDAGAPSGSLDTCMVNGSVVILFLRVR